MRGHLPVIHIRRAMIRFPTSILAHATSPEGESFSVDAGLYWVLPRIAPLKVDDPSSRWPVPRARPYSGRRDT